MLILDTSEIQARKPNPQAREISRADLATAPRSRRTRSRSPSDGHPYVLEFDEYNAGDARAAADPNDVGAGAHHRHRRRDASRSVVANLRLQVNQPGRPRGGAPATRARISPVAGLRGALLQHPDARSTRRSSRARSSPRACACSTSATSLHPKEIAYFVAPTQAARRERRAGQRLRDVASRRSCPSGARSGTPTATSGFYVLRVAESVWPGEAGAAPAGPADGLPVGRAARSGTHGIGQGPAGHDAQGARCAGCPRRGTRRSAPGAGACAAAARSPRRSPSAGGWRS